MKSRKIVSLLLTGAMTAALLAVPAQAAEAPQPYTIQATHWSREDFSQEASPEVFTGVYSRELLTPDEVRGLDNRYAILFIRGAQPVMDLKYELTQHPAIRHTLDGGGPPYIHHQEKPEVKFPGEPLFAELPDNLSDEEKEIEAYEEPETEEPQEHPGEPEED